MHNKCTQCLQTRTRRHACMTRTRSHAPRASILHTRERIISIHVKTHTRISMRAHARTSCLVHTSDGQLACVDDKNTLTCIQAMASTPHAGLHAQTNTHARPRTCVNIDAQAHARKHTHRHAYSRTLESIRMRTSMRTHTHARYRYLAKPGKASANACTRTRACIEASTPLH